MSFVNAEMRTPPGGGGEGLEAKAYRMAFFIHGCLCEEQRRETAKEIARKALRRLAVVAEEKKKRDRYRRPKGQIYRSPGIAGSPEDDPEQRLKGFARSNIKLERIHRLQCLVFEESEAVEKEQEARHAGVPLDQEDMIVRYVAYLVRTTMEKSSFYVHLGLCRFVYTYNAKETEELYRFLIQESPNRGKDGVYFRRRKAVIKEDLWSRFGNCLNPVTGERNEEYFERIPEPEKHSDLLNDCLGEFQPWEVMCCLPERFNDNDKLPWLYFDSQYEDDSHVELKRIHSLLHPDCFVKLVRAKRYDEPSRRLGLPQFLLNGNRKEG